MAANNENLKLPLLDLFTRLNEEAGFSLGIESYLILFKSLQKGFGMDDIKSLSRICRLLWTKSKTEEKVFNRYYDDFVLNLEKKVFSDDLIKNKSENNDNIKNNKESGAGRSDQEEIKDKLNKPVEYESERKTGSLNTTQDTQKVNYFEAPDLSSEAMDYTDDIHYKKYVHTDEYFPVTRRQMKQCWRYLRLLIREGIPVDIDVDATIEEIGKKGVFLKPVLMPRRINKQRLLLLIDREGSMVPFHILSDRIIDTASRSGRLGKYNIFYFKNCPDNFLFTDPGLLKYIKINDVLKNQHNKKTVLLIFSDAGAARGHLNYKRAEATITFYKILRRYIRRIVWLNPMPEKRWKNTTAEEIAKIIPMFEFSNKGFLYSINVLRGKYIYNTKKLNTKK